MNMEKGVANVDKNHILAIYGSPRKGGNTDTMLDAFLEGASHLGAGVSKLYTRDLQISGCLACGHCDRHGRCVQKDGMAQVYPLLEEATHLVVSSPVYFYGVPGQLKLLIDRSQAVFMKRELARRGGTEGAPESIGANPGGSRKGFLLCAGATRGKRLFECCVLTVQYFFEALSMSHDGELCFRELEERDAVLRQPSALEECRKAGHRFLHGS
jgi:multimeric flavodoxin WrbA